MFVEEVGPTSMHPLSGQFVVLYRRHCVFTQKPYIHWQYPGQVALLLYPAHGMKFVFTVQNPAAPLDGAGAGEMVLFGGSCETQLQRLVPDCEIRLTQAPWS